MNYLRLFISGFLLLTFVAYPASLTKPEPGVAQVGLENDQLRFILGMHRSPEVYVYGKRITSYSAQPKWHTQKDGVISMTGYVFWFHLPEDQKLFQVYGVNAGIDLEKNGVLDTGNGVKVHTTLEPDTRWGQAVQVVIEFAPGIPHRDQEKGKPENGASPVIPKAAPEIKAKTRYEDL